MYLDTCAYVSLPVFKRYGVLTHRFVGKVPFYPCKLEFATI